MKRFFLIFALALSFASIWVLKLQISIVLPVILSAVFFVLFLWLRRIRPLIFFKGILCFWALLCASLVFVSCFKAATYDRVVNFWNGKSATVSGIVYEEPELHDTYTVCYVKCDQLGGKPITDTFKFRMTCSNFAKIEAFDRITANVKFQELSKYTAGSAYADGVYIGTYSDDFIVTPGEYNHPYYEAIQLRRAIRARFKGDSEHPNRVVAAALLTGDKSGFSDSFSADVKTCGMSHIFAVSGLHISIVCMTVVTFLRRLRLGRKPTALIGMAIVVLMAAVAGFSGSILRAGLMYFLLFSGDLFSRRPDTLNSLSFAAVVLMLFNPYNLFGLSFELSAAGTLGIVLFADKMQKYMEKICPFYGIPRDLFLYVTGVFCVTLSAQVFILPLSLYTFGYISVIAPLVNFVLTVPIYFCLLCSLLCLMFGKVPYLSALLLKANDFLCTLLQNVITWFADNTKYPCFYSEDIFLYVFLLIVAAAVVLCIKFSKNKLAALSIIMACVFTLPALLSLQAKLDADTLSVEFSSTSSGNSMVLRRGSHVFLLLDPQSNRLPIEMIYYLDDHKTEKIDAVLISNDDSLRDGAFQKLEATYNVGKILSGKELQNLTVRGLGNVRVDCFGGEDQSDFLITIDNRTKILFNATGQSAQKSDVIFTEYPALSYKINGNQSTYILACGDSDGKKSGSATEDIIKSGAKVAKVTENSGMKAKMRKNQMLKFRRE